MFALRFIALFLPVFMFCPLVPKTYNKIKEVIQKANKPSRVTIWEIVQCLYIFETAGIDIDKIYLRFLLTSPTGDMIDFYEHMIKDVAPGIAANSIKHSNKNKMYYYVIRICSNKKQDMERVSKLTSETEVAQFCNAFNVAFTPKLMTKESVLNVSAKAAVNTFSKIYFAEGEYYMYYVVKEESLPDDFVHVRNEANFRISKMLGQL